MSVSVAFRLNMDDPILVILIRSGFLERALLITVQGIAMENLTPLLVRFLPKGMLFKTFNSRPV